MITKITAVIAFCFWKFDARFMRCNIFRLNSLQELSCPCFSAHWFTLSRPPCVALRCFALFRVCFYAFLTCLPILHQYPPTSAHPPLYSRALTFILNTRRWRHCQNSHVMSRAARWMTTRVARMTSHISIWLPWRLCIEYFMPSVCRLFGCRGLRLAQALVFVWKYFFFSKFDLY